MFQFQFLASSAPLLCKCKIIVRNVFMRFSHSSLASAATAAVVTVCCARHHSHIWMVSLLFSHRTNYHTFVAFNKKKKRKKLHQLIFQHSTQRINMVLMLIYIISYPKSKPIQNTSTLRTHMHMHACESTFYVFFFSIFGLSGSSISSLYHSCNGIIYACMCNVLLYTHDDDIEAIIATDTNIIICRAL